MNELLCALAGVGWSQKQICLKVSFLMIISVIVYFKKKKCVSRTV